MAALVFLHVNGIATLPDQDEIEQVTLRVAAGQVSKSELTEWLRERVE
jgi:prophage maintenance system killer protein